MNTREKQLLHGLYYRYETVGEVLPYESPELNWIANKPIHEVSAWEGEDGKLKRVEEDAENYMVGLAAAAAAAEQSLSYLRANGYLDYERDGAYFRISVTGQGADYARALHTFWGRLNLRYMEHKEGVLWFLATVLVSVITTLITMYVK